MGAVDVDIVVYRKHELQHRAQGKTGRNYFPLQPFIPGSSLSHLEDDVTCEEAIPLRTWTSLT